MDGEYYFNLSPNFSNKIFRELDFLHLYNEKNLLSLDELHLREVFSDFLFKERPIPQRVEPHYIDSMLRKELAAKHIQLNYAFGIRHIPEMKAAGADDLIYYTQKHGVSESTRSNLFYFKNGELYTPDAHILEGITRMKVLEIAGQHYPVHVQPCTLDDFLSADEVFTTGSTKRVLPIFSIDGKQVNGGQRGKITSHLYDLLVESEC